jgi:enamine deaminase RidA (YjgF/YER057c/UK114 family)
MMDRRRINPWSWQDRAGFSQAWRVDGFQTLVFVAGQGPVSPEGELVGDGDFEAQVRQTFANMRTVLEQAGASLESIVKQTVFLTDIGTLREYGRLRAELAPGPPPASTAVEIAALALPGMMIEVEAIAAV